MRVWPLWSSNGCFMGSLTQKSRSSSGSREQFGVSDKTRAKPHACIAAKLDFQAQRHAHRKSVVGGARVGQNASMHALAGGHLSCLGDASSDAQEKMRGAAALYFKSHYPSARIICYEPSAATHELLSANVGAIDGIETNQYGIWTWRSLLPSHGPCRGSVSPRNIWS